MQAREDTCRNHVCATEQQAGEVKEAKADLLRMKAALVHGSAHAGGLIGDLKMAVGSLTAAGERAATRADGMDRHMETLAQHMGLVLDDDVSEEGGEDGLQWEHYWHREEPGSPPV